MEIFYPSNYFQYYQYGEKNNLESKPIHNILIPHDASAYVRTRLDIQATTLGPSLRLSPCQGPHTSVPDWGRQAGARSGAFWIALRGRVGHLHCQMAPIIAAAASAATVRGCGAAQRSASWRGVASRRHEAYMAADAALWQPLRERFAHAPG